MMVLVILKINILKLGLKLEQVNLIFMEKAGTYELEAADVNNDGYVDILTDLQEMLQVIQAGIVTYQITV